MNISLEPLRTFLQEAGQFLPRLALALAIMVAGWLIAKVLKFAAIKGLRAINFHVVTERAGVDSALRQSGVHHDTSAIVAILVYWIVVLAALVVACDTLGLTQVTDVLRKVLLFVPNLFVGVLVIVVGAYFARFVATAIEAGCRSLGISDAAVLGKLAFYGILIFAVLTALDRLNITGELIRVSFLIMLAGVVLAFALAFGLGGRKWAATLIERWFSHAGGAGGTGGGSGAPESHLPPPRRSQGGVRR